MTYQPPQLVLIGAASSLVLGSFGPKIKFLDRAPIDNDIVGLSRNTAYA